MVEDKRSARRARMSGVRATYESAGVDVEANVLDLGAGGLFVRTATPLAVGKRISLELQIVGEPGPWSVLGRVVWVREKGEGEGAPPGMGVKFIDADEDVVAAIDRLVESRERTEPGLGRSRPAGALGTPIAPPQRESTVLGLGPSSSGPGERPNGAAQPHLPAAEASEAQPAAVLATSVPPPREPSIAIDLATRKSRPPPSAESPSAAAVVQPAPGRRAARGGSSSAFC